MHGSLDPDENVMDETISAKGLYSVFNPRGQKIADCGSFRDAVNLVSMRNCRWEGHYYQFRPIYETINMNSKKYFPSDDIIVNMDGGVGGSWSVKSDSIKLQPGVGDAVEFTT
tara:strand:+ start:659 stop:997 length:339 start_codon:yes stop_codon:yes gene_type:complete